MRKSLLSLACLLFLTGIVAAAEVTLVKFDADKKEVTVKEGDAQKIYQITQKTRFSFVDKAGNTKEATYDQGVMALSNTKAAGKAKMDITTDKSTITEVKLRGRKKN
jgi:hypothetical protein